MADSDLGRGLGFFKDVHIQKNVLLIALQLHFVVQSQKKKKIKVGRKKVVAARGRGKKLEKEKKNFNIININSKEAIK